MPRILSIEFNKTNIQGYRGAIQSLTILPLFHLLTIFVSLNSVAVEYSLSLGFQELTETYQLF